MIKRIVQVIYIFVGSTLGLVLFPLLDKLLKTDMPNILHNSYVQALSGAVIFFILSLWLVDPTVTFIKYIEEKLLKAPISMILFGSLGLVFGLILAFLISLPIDSIRLQYVSSIIQIVVTILLGYLGFQVGIKKREELLSLFTLSSRSAKKKAAEEQEIAEIPVKILDTSVIIDGRIADICQTGFIEGTIVIPQFVLAELQYIADSSDTLKRNRGRRGLDILNRIQKELAMKVEVYEGDFEDVPEVDAKLVKLAKLKSGILVTNDFNLNKVSELQQIKVWNINDLANAIKPVVLPGEVLTAFVVKEGKEKLQGVAYLDDGTMIVVEDGKESIGKRVETVVTSVLQTSAGRMIFAKVK
ncbi:MULTISPECIES: PIN/TRAM domain-containing protein [unclassified Bacillus (in: firmicutes)]|uniref:PIN/TRAM domain-containing protein n=1 Tax=unclassified Bacillus (in: firmicutes) TaxID=185979 RepID=UPI000BF14710|nr:MULTISPECIES: PIN/TRAM domain-containing protein [unclassified Bacillus (in: firmicutes)]PEJ47396.1 PIN domain nuclease [Bacillus sp. AFS002410]PEL08250.1 PIN domain nuclease [Bacillus sp. AFS017336]